MHGQTMEEPQPQGQLSYLEVVSIGIGGMVGGGIFAVLGLAVQLAHGGTPEAFFLAGMVALLTSYSYAHLSVKYPSAGGTVEFLNQAFGTGMITGTLNILLWISYMVMLSLYAFAFGSYGASFFPPAYHLLAKHGLISGVILVFTFINVLGATAVGDSEQWIVLVKVLILLLFVGAGAWTIETRRLMVSSWTPLPKLVAGGMIIFLAYEGFELIANAGGNVKQPEAILPRAYYVSVIFVILLYVAVAAVTVGNLPLSDIIAHKEYALAVSAKPFLGQAGFTLIAVAALLSTASAINATLYGAARISYVIARDGELPQFLERKIWHRPVEGLFLTAGVALLMANLFDLERISMMGSAGFLLIFAWVNGANWRLSARTGSSRWLAGVGLFACLGALAGLVMEKLQSQPEEILVLVIMVVMSFTLEALYRLITGRELVKVFKEERRRSQFGLGGDATPPAQELEGRHFDNFED
jgi:amino acid transporter